MSKSIVHERDLLYPTENLFEPGSIHIEILSPNKKGKMPVVIENKTSHSLLNYINSIVGIMQTDIFDRIHVNIKMNSDLYIKSDDITKKEIGDFKYINVVFNGDRIEYKGVSDIEP